LPNPHRNGVGKNETPPILTPTHITGAMT
jgi:hypothetical protein